MLTFNKILAVIDPSQDTQASLARALDIGRRTGGSVTAFLTIYDLSYEMTTMLSLDEREAMRQAVVDDRTEWLVELLEEETQNHSVPIDVRVVWNNRPYESVIYEVIDGHYDLIVKSTQAHDDLKSVIFTPTDWHLLRKAPVPVLLVKDHAWPDNGNIIAAVNVGTEDTEHALLNDKITHVAKDFSDMLHANVHLVNSFPGTPVNIAIEIPEFDPQGYNKTVQSFHQDSMRAHAAAFSIPEEQCHVREGLPEDAIPAVARIIDAELVIIGTVGRVGLSAALIGNTAEHVIDALNCDVLAVKPDGFECPLKR